MEEAPYWMGVKRKQILQQSHFPVPSMNSFNNSWEEKAFAEDAAGALGGCIWPPRSYTCSFCNREFRSAQALGGHMNVHRRDRARLKQSLSPLREAPHHHQNHSQIHSKSLVSNTGHNLDPNSNHSALSALSTEENFSEHTFVSAYYSSSITPSWSDSVGVRLLSISKSKPEVLGKNPREGSIFLGYDDYVETDLSVGMNSFASQNRPTGSCGDADAVSYKRPKSLSLFLKPCSDDGRHQLIQSEVIGNSMEDLDLELRLGDPPKMK